MNPMLHVALYHPAIPQNVGNIARTCIGLNAHLHLIHPMPFALTDHAVQRAGLDYWPHVRLTQHASDDAFLHWLSLGPDRQPRRPWLVTKFADARYDQPDYSDGDVLLLGNENSGLPDAWHDRWPGQRVHLPVLGPIRSFNVANAAAVTLTHATVAAGLADTSPHAPAGERVSPPA